MHAYAMPSLKVYVVLKRQIYPDPDFLLLGKSRDVFINLGRQIDPDLDLLFFGNNRGTIF